MANKTLPKVQVSAALRQRMIDAGQSEWPDALASAFADYKAAGKTEGLSDPYFGSDDFYDRPLRGGRRVLRHVHLRPNPSNQAAVMEWDRRTRNKLHKTSDAVLIYAEHPTHGYLLLHIVEEHGAHDFAEMRITNDMQTMMQLANIAEEFTFWGRVRM